MFYRADNIHMMVYMSVCLSFCALFDIVWIGTHRLQTKFSKSMGQRGGSKRFLEDISDEMFITYQKYMWNIDFI